MRYRQATEAEVAELRKLIAEEFCKHDMELKSTREFKKLLAAKIKSLQPDGSQS